MGDSMYIHCYKTLKTFSPSLRQVLGNTVVSNILLSLFFLPSSSLYLYILLLYSIGPPTKVSLLFSVSPVASSFPPFSKALRRPSLVSREPHYPCPKPCSIGSGLCHQQHLPLLMGKVRAMQGDSQGVGSCLGHLKEEGEKERVVEWNED